MTTQLGGSWLNSYRALLNWGYEPETASAMLSSARTDGSCADGTTEVVYYVQAGTFILTLKGVREERQS